MCSDGRSVTSPRQGHYNRYSCIAIDLVLRTRLCLIKALSIHAEKAHESVYCTIGRRLPHGSSIVQEALSLNPCPPRASKQISSILPYQAANTEPTKEMEIKRETSRHRQRRADQLHSDSSA